MPFWLSNYIKVQLFIRKVLCLYFSFKVSGCLDSEFQTVEVISQRSWGPEVLRSWGPRGPRVHRSWRYWGSLDPRGCGDPRGPKGPGGPGVPGLGPAFLQCPLSITLKNSKENNLFLSYWNLLRENYDIKHLMAAFF